MVLLAPFQEVLHDTDESPSHRNIYIFNFCFLSIDPTGTSVVVIICSDQLGDSWYTANLQTNTGILSEVTQRSQFSSSDISKCFILATTSKSYSSSTVRNEREGYVSTEYSNVGITSLGDWNDVITAVRVMGVNSFALYFSFATDTDDFFVTYYGDLIWFGDRNYFVSYFAGTEAPGWYAEMASSLTDGTNAIVLGSYRNTLPILGKISNIVSLQGK